MAKQSMVEARWVRMQPTHAMAKRNIRAGAVYIEVDFEKIAKVLGEKAALSKGGGAVECSGAVDVAWHEDDREKVPPLPQL